MEKKALEALLKTSKGTNGMPSRIHIVHPVILQCRLRRRPLLLRRC